MQLRKTRVYMSVPHLGEDPLCYVREAVEGNWISTVGPNVVSLEEEMTSLLGLPAVAIQSATAGLHLALRLIGVSEGDEVVTPALSFAASTNPIRYERATPVFIDSESNTWNMDPNLLGRFLRERARVNRLPRAVIVVHLFGQPAEMDAILELCQHYDLPIIEDAAESLGARYHGRHPGGFGDVGVFSFSGNKMITGSTGGLLVSNREGLVGRARKWSTQAIDMDPEGIRGYLHSELGYNYAMSNVVAGLVRAQLLMLEARVEARRAVFSRYVEQLSGLPGITPQVEVPGCRHSRWLSCFLVDEKSFGMSAFDLIRFLDRYNVEARSVWRPMHLQPLYQACELIGGEVAERLNRSGICLPSSSSLSEEDQQYVIDVIRAAHRSAVGCRL